jgi:hypothetical protein
MAPMRGIISIAAQFRGSVFESGRVAFFRGVWVSILGKKKEPPIGRVVSLRFDLASAP